MNNIKNEIYMFKSEFLELNTLIKDNMKINDKIVENDNLTYIENIIEELLNAFY